MKSIQIRQGDVMAIEIEKLPKGLKKKKDNILVHSDSTLHDHTLVKGTVFIDKDGKLFADVPVKTQIVHTMDHAPVDLPRGKYEIRRQVQHTMGDMTAVVRD
ncbi:MAG: hypothetical protein ACRDFB_00755 [Rhabdochlamydiaceae bacterium]